MAAGRVEAVAAVFVGWAERGEGRVEGEAVAAAVGDGGGGGGGRGHRVG